MMSFKRQLLLFRRKFQSRANERNFVIFFIVESEANKTNTTAVFPLEALVMCCIKRERKTVHNRRHAE